MPGLMQCRKEYGEAAFQEVNISDPRMTIQTAVSSGR